MAVTVRRARAEDAQKIAEFALALVAQHEAYDRKRFARIADREQMAAYYGRQTKAEGAAVLVAEVDGEVVGFAFVEYEAVNYAGLLESAAWLHDIYVEEKARGHQAGTPLIEASVAAAKELGAGKLMLSAAAQNEHARNFFEHHGFRTTMFEMMLDLTEKGGE